MSELGLELEERDGGVYVTGVQEHGCVAVHGMFLFPSLIFLFLFCNLSNHVSLNLMRLLVPS